MTEHTAHDAHVYAGDDRCICCTDATNVRCPNPADGADGFCGSCRAGRATQ